MNDLNLFFLSDSCRKIYEQGRDMSSGFRTKTRTSVICFPHADPAVRIRMHPARASVQRS